MALYKCARCRPTKLPDDLAETVKIEAARMVRDASRMQAILQLRSLDPRLDLYGCKGIALHITLKKGHCHHCQATLDKAEGACPKCRRLNFDW